ncbi:DUF1080 domain-containing protein [Blastopirellula sp. JC732]|uniref:DUF1080 domain-containing protein n=1 Tax=Blastopirellula sediminis TaxID=2894196 RepID=A0A9X1MKN5_9BACT|nr:DUF1080 domain-containing protein [Blastopirellula sediminis]MCC9608480.1 DUF1080 domain-containing protein [Blastopirellula sediminis]MCC9628743.1 DUF1080 domain-containing protein [Blastopirellula sediminis]
MKSRIRISAPALACFLILGAIGSLQAETELLSDHFVSPKHPARRAARGDWQVKEGVISCPFDQELYKKFKDHGPIVFYDLAYRDAVIRFSFKATESTIVTFTENNAEGHVFRIIMRPEGYNVRAFPPEGEKHSIQAAAGKEALFQSGEWVDMQVTSKGEEVTVKIGDKFEQTFRHTSYGRDKKNFSVSFNEGTFALKDVVVKAY